MQNGNMATVELSIPGGKCGLIIGKNGETIKGLQVSKILFWFSISIDFRSRLVLR